MNKKNKGFTFVELLVVLSVIGLLIPVIFSIIFAVMRQQVKIIRLTEVKRQGDYVLSTMKTLIQNNAITIASDSLLQSEECDIPNSSYVGNGTGINFYLGDKTNHWFQFDGSMGEKVASRSASGDFDLTTNKVRIENFLISCTRRDYFTAPLIVIKFDICYNRSPGSDTTCDTVDRPEESALLQYETRIKLRNL